MTKSQTAERKGIDNEPNEKEIQKLIALAQDVLQPIRNQFGQVTVNSGFRCLELNRELGSKDTSQHCLGEAADIEVAGLSNMELAEWIKHNCEFDQLILEFWYPGAGPNSVPGAGPNSGWVHLSYKDDGTNRKEVLTINKHGVFRGLGY
jgi:hypothetical protein